MRPPWDSYIWANQAVPSAGSAVDSGTVIDLTENTDANGRLAWDAPPGRWVVMRSGMIPIGTLNSDVLIHRAKVVGGRITVPNGPSYAVLVLPRQSVMRPEVAKAIRRLVREGASVIGPKPASSPSLAGYPQCDHEVAAIGDDVWGSVDGHKVTTREFGKGKIHDGVDLVTVLGDLGVQPDVQAIAKAPLLCAAAGAGKIGSGKKGGIVFKHRSTPDRDIYFLSNTTDQPVEFTASLRVTGRQPELWNADRGTIAAAAAFTQRDGRTLVPLRLDAAESIYVVCKEPIRPDAAGTASSNTPEFETVATLGGPWTVRFGSQGAPAEAVFETLTDWAKHPDAAIRHYSGTAVYETEFTLVEPPKNQRTVLSLGEVAVIATVLVNSRDAGTAWTTPWEIDISDMVKAGNNTLQVRVANSWHNRLVADAALPPEQRQSHASQPYRTPKNKPLLSSGLLGPVRIMQSGVAR